MDEHSFWKDKKVLLTGHTGFKGCWLTLFLEHLGASVYGLSLPAEKDSLYESLGKSVTVHSRYVDIVDADAVAEAVAECRPDVVFHLAAQPLVRRSYDEPVHTFSVNVVGTASVLDAVRKTGTARSVVVVTTDKCYEDQKWVWGYRENDRLGGYDPYSSSKAAAELVAASMRSSFFGAPGAASVATARAGNVIGGGDWARDRLIPDLVRAFSRNEAAVLRNPSAVRPWQHVLESLAGYLLLARKGWGGKEYAEAWNFGPDAGENRRVDWIVDEFRRQWGGGETKLETTAQPHETGVLLLDNSKAKQRLGWSPRLGLGTALKWTADWYRRFLKGESAAALCREQIADYMALKEKE